MRPKSPQQSALQNTKINFFQDLDVEPLVHRPVCNLAAEAEDHVGEKILKNAVCKVY